jgi:hypothetical protein
MTSRRLVLAAADHLVTAISHAFWLNRWAKTLALVAGRSPLASAPPGAVPDPIPTLCTPGIGPVAELDDRALRTEPTPVSPLALEEPARLRLSPLPGLSHPISSGSEQIPLLVARAGELQTGHRRRELRTSRGRFGAKSLNPHLSLERRAA